MRRFWALLGSAAFFVVTPGTIAVLLPWSITQWQMRPAFFGVEALRYLGTALILVGLIPLVESFVRFAWKGLGTPAPIAPPSRLVVTGFYRRVRNPIYVALLMILVGEALFFADARLLWLAAGFWLFFHLAVVVQEEPTLREWFGADYLRFKANVPRWLPRLTPWNDATP
jgi:protein-S-isoprenylcysteine O-methyltransferase Ste14